MASRVLIACTLSAAVLAVAGCVSMPSSGPPNSLGVNQANEGQGQNYVGLSPQPPQPYWKPETVVQGFLAANASYYTATDIVKQYLTPSEQQTWNPGSSVTVFRNFNVTLPSPPAPASKSQQASVSVSGLVRAALNGSGQQLYASAQGNGLDSPPSSSTSTAPCPVTTGKQCSYAFKLDKVNGQWRIANAPKYLLLDQNSFDNAWEPQDLYFFDTLRRVLVPDSVFVPIGTGETDLLNKLADALKNGPADAGWLSGAISNVFSAHITSVSVSVAPPSTAVVSLKGALTASDQQSLQYVAAELVWTLTAASAHGPPITGVQLVINNVPQAPVIRSSTYDPYPLGPASFTFVDKNGVPQSLCGWTGNSPIGTPTPIFGHAGSKVATCGGSAASNPPSFSSRPTASASTAATEQANSHKPGGPATKPPGNAPANKASAKAVSMVAVSPDGKYIAEVSNGDQLSIGTLGGSAAPKPVSSLQSSEITSISWDRQDDLWLSQDGSVLMVPQPQAGQVDKFSPVNFPGPVDALSVAPDGIRIAMIVQSTPASQTNQLLLASINPNGSQTGQLTLHGDEGAAPAINTPQVPLGPGITNAKALTWYDADDLVVLTPSGAGDELQEVPVDGRASTKNLAPPQTSSGETVTSIAAGNGKNVVVAGLSDGKLEVSAGLDGPWALLGLGSAPAYLIPPAPTAPPYLVQTLSAK